MSEASGRVYAWLKGAENDFKLRWFPDGAKPTQHRHVEVLFPREVYALWHDFLREMQDDPGFHWVEGFFRDIFLEGARSEEFDQQETLYQLSSFLKMGDFDRLVSPLLQNTIVYAGYIVDVCKAIHLAGATYGPHFSDRQE